MKVLILIASLTSVLSQNVYAQRVPISEKAAYKVDLDRSRTSSMVKSGTFDAFVVGESLNVENSYQVDLNYKFNILFQGNTEGTEQLDIDAEYFTEEFLVLLRDQREYQGQKFKVRHLGFGDARTMDGSFYPNCDILLFYDIDTEQSNYFNTLFKKIAMEQLRASGTEVTLNGEIQDLKVHTYIKYGVPVLGAVKIDVSGRYNRMAVKAGADYKNPAATR